jgi:hypothetical protein
MAAGLKIIYLKMSNKQTIKRQGNPNPKTDHLKPWHFKKGQSGNPAGRPKGKTLKEYCKDFLTKQTPEERDEFLQGIPKEIIWKMAEGNPENQTDLTTKGEPIKGITYVQPK